MKGLLAFSLAAVSGLEPRAYALRMRFLPFHEVAVAITNT